MPDKRDHEYVPVHEIMSDAETKSLLEKMGLRKENLPKILEDDPQALKLGAKLGQVLRIKRNDYGNEHSYYRLVVEA